MSPNFDLRFWGARGAAKGARKIEVRGTYPCMVSSKNPGTPTPTIFVPSPENQLMLWNVSDGPWTRHIYDSQFRRTFMPRFTHSGSSPVSERPRTTVSVGALHPGLQC